MESSIKPKDEKLNNNAQRVSDRINHNLSMERSVQQQELSDYED